MLQFVAFILFIVSLFVWAYRLDVHRASNVSKKKRVVLIVLGVFLIVVLYAIKSLHPVYVVTLYNKSGKDIYVSSNVIADSSMDSSFWQQSELVHKSEAWVFHRYRFCYRWTCTLEPYPLDLRIMADDLHWDYRFELPLRDTLFNPCSDFFICHVGLSINETGAIFIVAGNESKSGHQPNDFPVRPN